MNDWYELKIQPRDVLFFRGAKPMSGASIGEGGSWPVPSVLHQSMLSALHGRWPELDTDVEHRHTQGDYDKNSQSSFRFGGLQTVGMFPCHKTKGVYLPTPSDLQFSGTSEKLEEDKLSLLKPEDLDGIGDLPRPLTKGVVKPGGPTKNKPLPWLSLGEFERYLHGDISGIIGKKNAEMYAVESRTGIGIDADSGTTEEGTFYLAEYLRLNDDYLLTGLATCEHRRYADGGQPVDLLARFFGGEHENALILGGQRGVAYLSGEKVGCFLDKLSGIVDESSKRIKWVTLTPSVFSKGWLPGWVNVEDGSISAPEVSRLARQPGQSRKVWRDSFEKKTMPGRLVAASVPKPLAYSGWRVHGGKDGGTGVRPTRLCVPAGAVYYFEIPEGESAEPLINLLNGRCKSDIGAEKGFGLGVCGNW